MIPPNMHSDTDNLLLPPKAETNNNNNKSISKVLKNYVETTLYQDNKNENVKYSESYNSMK